MLRNLRLLIDRRPLATPFRIARGVRHVADLLVVELEEQGIVGRGEGAPIARYGESVESCVAQLEALRGPIEAGMTRAALGKALGPGAARNALDCALWDLEARRAGTSAAALAAAPAAGAIVTARTVGIDTPAAMAHAAAALAGEPLVKVKVDANDPAAQLRAVRQAAPDPTLIVDANEAWSPDLLTAMLPVLAELRVMLLEQPLPAGADDALAGLHSATPICADESCHVAADVERLAGRYQAVNIKLDKTGGLTEALALLTAARAAGMQVMTGCMICSSLSIAPAFLVAAQADFADLDGPLWLADDHADGVRLAGGRLAAPSGDLWGGR
ncbi:N-acetyl-D-Glu racemase DgcA [Sphingomonas flavalba]|uniref:N-acetyl-D-Glu racemase DgcA n=1 Tax=Sphingomonas flavalba TaxID=2559804 RepID=UPI00109DA138|nr:N-acetyl-D-Glu racemase DgcA [Sphingomonas flavalba]